MPLKHPPSFPQGCPRAFRATVHGTVFGGRDRHLSDMHAGDPVQLMADPPGQDEPAVWVHLVSGEPIGHLPPEISSWLWPWISEGGVVEARAVRVEGEDTPSWRRVVLEVECRAGA
jgi:hypothetical protein